MYYNQQTIELVKNRYKQENGDPFVMTSGQNEIFDIIFGRRYPLTQATTYTQYGKTETVGLAVLTRVSTFPEEYIIVAPTSAKGSIMMKSLIGHIFDNEYTRGKFVIEKSESADRIRRERNRTRLTFKISDGRIGAVSILSIDNRKQKNALDKAMGHGGKNIILEESSLIDDRHYAGIIRMIGGHKDPFFFEIGNPFRRNHFYRSSLDPRYHQIVIDYHQGIKEGRLTPEFIELARSKMTPDEFRIMYDCKFPDEGRVDDQGWLVLLTEAEVKNACVPEGTHFGAMKYGVDVAGGGRNFSTIIKRSSGFAEIKQRTNSDDTASLASQVLFFKNEDRKALNYDSAEVEIAVDANGIGKGCFDIIRNETVGVTGVIGGSKARLNDRFMNMRAEMFWRLREWILAGGRLIGTPEEWKELLVIKWRVRYDKRIQIISKDELSRDGIQSPDVADGLSMTFATGDVPLAHKTAIKKEIERINEAVTQNKNRNSI